MSLTKYRILISALEHGSLTAAAEELGYTQSGVSHMLNSLENELGVQLVVRSRTGVRPTSTGEMLIPYIKKVLSAESNFEQALSEVTGLLKGKLIIGSFTTASSFFLPKIIAEFQKMYPNITYELRGGTYEEIEQWIENNEVECGFVSLPTKKNFKTVPIISDRLVVVTGKHYKHKFDPDNCVTLKDLENEDIILIDGKDDYDRTNLFIADINKLKIKITTSDAFATVRMIENNLGVGIMPIYLAFNFSDSLDIFELDESLHERRDLAFAYLSKKEASPVVKKFINFIEEKHAKTAE